MCNLNRTVPKDIVVYSHNMSGYDGHFLAQKLKKDSRIWSVTALPLNTEKFRTLTINRFKFVDSSAFLASSLSKLVDNLSKTDCKFNILDQVGLYDDGDVCVKKLLLQKGIFPYEFCTSLEQMRATRELPEKHHFYSHLKNEGVTSEEFSHAQTVWKALRCDNLLTYCEYYCMLDTALLAEVMDSFRKLIREDFGLDSW